MFMIKLYFGILGCLALFCAILPASRFAAAPVAQIIPATTNIQLEPVLSGLSSPVYLTHAHDGSNRLFIVEQQGRIKVLQPGSTTPTVFLDIMSKVLSGGERGLLGLAFHPQYPVNRRFFVNYTRQTDGATVVAEYRTSASNPHVADTAETVLLTISQPFSNHNGGMVEFGPDGYLYIGMGDGGSGNDPGNRAQNINELLGKMLRLNVDQPNGTIPYSSPSDNPFFGSTPGRDEIYATGLRNPWRFSFDRATGRLYAADVGQGAIEEIDIITRGGNYGWRVYEGTRCTNNDPALCNPSNYIAPIVEYSHTGGRCSVTGGYVYRGTRGSLPVGAYVYADYCTGEIFMLDNGTQYLLRDTSIFISAFGEDEAGEIYVVGLGGTVHRLVNASPVASVSASSYSNTALGQESIVAAFGANLTNTTMAAASTPLPTTLAGTTVRVIDSQGIERLAPLFYVSPTQVNYQLPPGAATGTATVTITGANNNIATGTIQVAEVNPGLFTASANGMGVAAGLALRIKPGNVQTYEPIAQFDAAMNKWVSLPINLGPATDQVYLVLFGTGIRFHSQAPSATFDGVSVQVTFAGAQNQFVGLDQVNIFLPNNLVPRGEKDLILTVDGKQANTVRVNVQ
jgi:uncharacterized protein (TIGR03437 family)